MQTLADIPRHHGRHRPDGIALSFKGATSSYRTLDARTNQIANALSADQIGSGTRIAVLTKNSDRYFELFFGATKVGAVLVPVNFRLAPPEVSYVVNDAHAVAMFVDDEHADLVAGIQQDLPRLRKIIHLGDGRGDWPAFADWYGVQSPEDPNHPLSRQDVAIQMYTSGTTGRPKGAQLTHDNLLYALQKSEEDFGSWSDDDVNLVCMPLFHIAGTEWGLVGLYHGVPNIVLPEVDPAEILRLIQEARVSRVLFVPAVILFLMQTPGVAEIDFSSLRQVVYGASPIPLDLLQQAVATLKCDFVQVYGLTETTGAVTLLPPEDHGADTAERMKSCGLPMSGVEIKIVDEQGGQMPTGTVGEIICRTRQNMLGYWNLAEATDRAIRGDWFYTGDAGYVDQDGYVYIHDRIKDMVVSGGENIYPAEVESALFEHPDIADVAVIGVPDEKWGEAVKAIVVARADAALTEAAVRDFARSRLAGYKTPASVDFTDQLPRNPSGKILKRELREPYWQGRDREVN